MSHTRYKCRRRGILDKRKQREESGAGIRGPSDGDGDENKPRVLNMEAHTFAIHSAGVAHTAGNGSKSDSRTTDDIFSHATWRLQIYRWVRATRD